MKNYGLIGKNIAFSKSPLIYNHWFKQYSMNASYSIIEVEEKDLCTSYISHLIESENYQGFNITKPYKELFLKDYILSAECQKIQAINTLVVNNELINAHNTDYLGLLDSFNFYNLIFAHKKVLILGAGGAAKSLVYALSTLNVPMELTIINRNVHKALQLQKLFSASKIIFKEQQNYDIVFNATSIEFIDVLSNINHLKTAIDAETIFYDLNYKNSNSAALAAFLGYSKINYMDGRIMLIAQAAHNFNLWFSIKPLIDEKVIGLIL